MKKKLMMGLITLCAASMLCGFDSAETADSVVDKMQAASTGSESMSMTMGMNCDLLINIGDGTTTSSLAMLLNGEFDVAAIVDPLSMSMEGSMDMSMLGEAQTLTMKMYMVPNEANELETYVYTEDSATGEGYWTYETAAGLDMTALMEQSADISMTAADMAEWGLVFELAPEAADVDGTECYVLSTAIDSATLTTVMDKAMAMAGEDVVSEEDLATLDQAMALLEGLKIDLEYYVDTTTFLPVKMHIDMNESDMTMLNSVLTAFMATTNEDGTTDTSTTAEIVVNDLSVDAFISYEPVEAITVPEEAIAAVESGEAISADEVIESAM